MATLHTDVVGEVWRLTVAAKYPDNQWQEPSFHLQCLSTSGNDTKLAVCQQMDTLIQAHILQTLATSVTYLGSRMSPAHTTPPWLPYTTTPNYVGLSTSNTSPTQVRPLISTQTEKSGRAWRGRFYGFTPAAAFVTVDGSPTTVLDAQWIATLDPWRAGLSINGSLWGMVLNHRQGPPPAPLLAPDPITKLAFSPLFATQRRSGEYGRPNSPPWE